MKNIVILIVGVTVLTIIGWLLASLRETPQNILPSESKSTQENPREFQLKFLAKIYG